MVDTEFPARLSLAFLSLGALSSLTLYACAAMLGPYVGVKIAALAFLFSCPLTMFSFVRRLCPGDGWTAFSCGVAYTLAPALLLRLGHVEHVANVLGFAAIPLVFQGVLVFLEERTARAAVMCARPVPCWCFPMRRSPFSSYPCWLCSHSGAGWHALAFTCRQDSWCCCALACF